MVSKPEEIRNSLSKSSRIVVKIGTNSLTGEDSELDDGKIDKIVSDLMDLVNLNKEVILVSSGAIGAGIGKLSLHELPEDIESLQAASTIGQGELMRKYSESFEQHGRHVAQLLLTSEDFTNPTRFENLKNTVKELLNWGVIPIINENDAVAVEEIRMGDNDLLSAFTAAEIGADLLIILTDVDGLYAQHPKKEKSAELIRTVEKINSEIQELTKETTEEEFGGIVTKVQAAKIATEEGVPVIVTNSSREKVLREIIDGKEIGTLFMPQR
ncbi:glutamate 5-kinase [candidate division MSBL1 archaeon SCGC-AAA259D14]|uniref:Glutamate 5-kinase n=5 Tax=candidate division MSBL1 TaxID=215777 RepID=A0A133URF9_9EURY|nr:glutamate 5-kinase [candidate division MSBL1 archaeon SCGC-AAA259D14]KXA92695.1 glutamate 5-kinase [candidate division MSBL1 archaeon SCGC-AAA259E22]KXA95189.1 glutamate 5-kinase [candidate division MSBL1 archaeon SCGC-AAA259I07]KXA96696.1 glutamate 5-kinase [candidate division MSBL1 archaeon SCGC-AAA259I14]KXA98386.1 glutamate 5-kinase [candidate division MSBL1 archaeon SCGC-AAA259J03]